MPSVQIKHVPEATPAVLRRRAAAAHQSLQEYLLTKLIDEARAPTTTEIFDEIEARGGPGRPRRRRGQRDDPGRP